MKRRSKPQHNPEELRNRIIGMGENSLRKSYFPQLKQRLGELEQYRTILDQAHDGICLLDPESLSFHNCNKAGRELIDMNGDEPQTLMDLLRDPSLRDAFNKWLTERGNAPFSCTIELPGTPPHTLTATFSRSALEDNQEQLLALFRDVTDQQRLEEELFQRRKMDAVGELAGGIAHDFNNMLSGIIGATEILQMSQQPDSQEGKMIAMIMQTANRAADLTKQLLSFSRKGKIRSTVVDMHQIITDTIQLLQRSIDKQITVIARFKAPHSAIVGDPSQLQNALLNLAINARDAIDGAGEICFSTSTRSLTAEECHRKSFAITPGDYIEVSVSDTGSGIPQEHIATIFEPFFTTKEEGKGTGLGLAAVYGTTLEHQGAITVDTSPAGTTFRLLIPLEQQAEITHTTEEKARTGSGRILLVDDEEIIRTTGRFILEHLGYTIEEAENGMVALEKVQNSSEPFSLIILDMVMPQMGGEECFTTLHKLIPQTPIIIASGFPRNARIEELIRHGLTAFIQKPYHIQELSQLVSKSLKR